MKASDITPSQFRKCHCQQLIPCENLFVGQLHHTPHHKVSPIIQSCWWQKLKGETFKYKSVACWHHLQFSINFSWHEASVETTDRWWDKERIYVWVQIVFSHYFGFVCVQTLSWGLEIITEWSSSDDNVRLTRKSLLPQPTHTPTQTNPRTNTHTQLREHNATSPNTSNYLTVVFLSTRRCFFHLTLKLQDGNTE